MDIGDNGDNGDGHHRPTVQVFDLHVIGDIAGTVGTNIVFKNNCILSQDNSPEFQLPSMST